MGGAAPMNLTMITEQSAPAEDERGGGPPSAAAAAYQVNLTKMDLSGGLDVEMLKGTIRETAKGLIGVDEEIEFDMPLMESGLTSGTAVLLRDALSQQLPGVNLPVTMVFDYPSITSMSELIMENAEKAAKKAAKGK